MDEAGLWSAQIDAASVLAHHVLGVASRHGAGSRLTGTGTDRQIFLESAITSPVHADGERYRFFTRVSRQTADHDQLRTGVEMVVAGIAQYADES